MVPVQDLEATSLALVRHYWGGLKHTNNQQHGFGKAFIVHFHIPNTQTIKISRQEDLFLQ